MYRNNRNRSEFTVANSYIYINSTNYTGGICGYNKGIIINCHNNGTVIGKGNVGGICGGFNGASAVIADCSNAGTITGIIVETNTGSGQLHRRHLRIKKQRHNKRQPQYRHRERK